MVRGNRERLEQIVDAVPSHVEEVIVHHLQAEDLASKVMDEIKVKRGCQVTLRKICPTLGVHLGMGVVGAAWLEKDPS
jgi:fatty acid-binding protein DegV